jgi:hypothetical protein
MDAAGDNSSQYILITPQGKFYMMRLVIYKWGLTFFSFIDASNMVPGPHVTIHRMRDPERHS